MGLGDTNLPRTKTNFLTEFDSFRFKSYYGVNTSNS